MRALWSWLGELVEFDRELGAEEAAAALTAAGFEVETIEPIGQDFSGVVVAEVVGKRRHPNADKLSLVDVIDTPGGTATQVVCGANNVPDPGGRVLWAKPGAILPGFGEISTRAIKGVDSPGMLCAEDELGLGDDHAGIIVLGPDDILHGSDELLGDSRAIERLGLRDYVFDVGVHPNRGDALGHLGLARELVALLGGRLRDIDERIDAALASVTTDASQAADHIAVHIDDPEGCPRYTARYISGVAVKPAPLWMQQRLRAVGVRPLSNLVDVTNYVMFELGQPLHAFDYKHVRGGEIRVRRAQAGERMTTLDDVERTLEANDLLICDGSGPVALAGVMGGADSEVSDDTHELLLESAGFAPAMVRRTARRLGLHSEASARFERGVDPNLAERASRLAASLLARLGGGQVAAGVVDNFPRPPEPKRLTLRASRASSLVGIEFGRDQAASVLSRLGIDATPSPDDDDQLAVVCPTYRADLLREVDLIEDLLRIHGFDKVPGTLPQGQVPPTRQVDPRPEKLRAALIAAGMSETISFGFTSRERIAALGLPDSDRRAKPIAIRNPMSQEQAVMRTSLLPGLLAAIGRNVSHGVSDVALFEIGSVFLPAAASSSSSDADGSLPDEPTRAAGVIAGHRPGWLTTTDEVDLFDLKGPLEQAIEAALPADSGQVSFVADNQVPYMHPGVCARVVLSRGNGDAIDIGHIGEIHPATRRALGDLPRCFGFEIAIDAFPVRAPVQMQGVPRYPAITRDISMLLDDSVPAARVRSHIEAASEPLIEHITVLEDFRDPAHVPSGKKGMLWSITYRSPESTLTDAEVDKVHERLVAGLLSELSATRR